MLHRAEKTSRRRKGMLALLARALRPAAAAAEARRAPGRPANADSAANPIAGLHPERVQRESARALHTTTMPVCHPAKVASNNLQLIARNGPRVAFGPQNSASHARTSTSSYACPPAAPACAAAIAIACLAIIGLLRRASNPRPAQAAPVTNIVTTTEPTKHPPSNHLTLTSTHSVPTQQPSDTPGTER